MKAVGNRLTQKLTTPWCYSDDMVILSVFSELERKKRSEQFEFGSSVSRSFNLLAMRNLTKHAFPKRHAHTYAHKYPF